jgi:large subunit ribosomal protein L23
MALFSRKKVAPETTAAAVVAAVTPKAQASDRNLSAVIIRPRITEKAVGKGEHNVYTFEVQQTATKFMVRDAIKALYNVTPVKVNIVNKAPARRVRGMQRREVAVPGLKKAYVYLKKGDTITLV